jgi:glucose/arabinose dehydrogenase
MAMTLKAFRIAVAVSSVLATSYAASAQSNATPPPTTLPSTAITDLEIPEGLEARVWAQSPQLLNPTNIDVDARGRIWATEAVNYRETQSPKHALQHPNGDRVMILEDTDGDGVADASKVFVEDKDLTAPLGIAVIDNKVFVSCSPNLIVYTDEDGDDKPDKKEIFLKGFGGFDHDHGLHAVTGFLDGRLYFNAGNCGPHQVTDKSGWKLNSGSCYIHGNLNPDNTGNRKSDDSKVWVGGIALRYDADGTMMRRHRAQLPQLLRDRARQLRQRVPDRQRRRRQPGRPRELGHGRRRHGLLLRRRHADMAGGSSSRAKHTGQRIGTRKIRAYSRTDS